MHKTLTRTVRRATSLFPGAVSLFSLGLFALALTGLQANAQELQSLDCSMEKSLKSLNADTATSVDFVNETAGAIVVYWLNYSGDRVQYNIVQSGSHYVQETYVTHPWVVTDQQTGNCLAIFQPEAGPHTALLCGVPSGEVTLDNRWGPAGVHFWNMILEPTTANFAGRTVTEQDPGGGTDSCWFAGSAQDPNSGSKIPPQTHISGGHWTVNAQNGWGDDAVGWGDKAIDYYRKEGKAPCGFKWPQRMVMSCGTTVRAYLTDDLQAGFTKTEVWSQRAAVKRTREWPKD